MNIPKYKKLLSYIFPLSLRKWNGRHSRNLQLTLHRNILLLSTPTAIYSHGHDYRPLTVAFEHTASSLSQADNILFLGCGLGSGLQILNKLGHFPHCTLVDIEEDFLDITQEIAPAGFKDKLTCVCEDAALYISHPLRQFAMTIVDIFIDTTVPEFVLSDEFMRQCHHALLPKGVLVLNYIGNSIAETNFLYQRLQALYHYVQLIPLGHNIVFIAYKQASKEGTTD